MTSRFIMPFADVGSGIKPSSGAKLFFFKTDGVTPKDTFSDKAGTIPNTNPVISDSNGVFSNIYIVGDYKVTLKDKNDSLKFSLAEVSEVATNVDANVTVIKVFDTIQEFKDYNIEFPDGKTIHLNDRNADFIKISGVGAATGFKIIASTSVNQSIDLKKHKGSYYAKGFGLIGNNVANDTAAFAAFAVFSKTNECLFDAGIYLIDEYIVESGTRLKSVMGAAFTTIKLRTDTGDKVLRGEGISDVSIEGFTVDSRKADFATLRTTIQFNFTTGGSNISIVDVTIPGSTSAGIVVDRTAGVVIKANIMDCVGGDGLRCSNSSDIDLDVRLTKMQSMLSTRRPLQIGSCTGVTGKFHVEDAILTFALDFGASSDMTLFGTVHRCLKYLDLEGNAKDITLTCAATGLDDGNGAGNGFTVFENGSGLTCSNIVLNGSISGFFQGVRIEGGREITINAAIKDCHGEGISIVDGSLSNMRSQNIVINSSVVNCVKTAAGTRDGVFIDGDKVTFNGVSNGVNHRFDIQTASTCTDVLLNAVTGGQGRSRGESFTYKQLDSVRWFETAFNPENFITANPGSMCSRTTGQFYIKQSVTSNTGWVLK